MRLTVLVVALLVIGPSAGLAQSPASLSDADRAEAAGRYEEALAVYQRLAAADARDHQARLAIARLQERLGHPARAEAVFRSVMLENPRSIEATLGVARTLVEQLHAEDALDVLDAAERLAPGNPDVLAALGHAHGKAGHTATSVSYYERAAAISRSQEHLYAFEQARLAHEHRVESRSFGEQYNGATPDSRATDLAVNLRLNNALRITGRGQVQRKLGLSDARGGGGVQWRATGYTTFAVQALVGRDNAVMPGQDYLAEVDHIYGATTWTAGVRYFDFNTATVTTVSPALTWRAADHVSLTLRYALSLTDRAGKNTAVTKGHSADLRGTYRVHPRVIILAGYAYGVDDFDTLSVDRIGAFSAHTALIGARAEFSSLTSVAGSFERQSRPAGVTLQRFTLTLAQRF